MKMSSREKRPQTVSFKKYADTWPLNLPAVGDKVRSAILNVVIYSSPCQHSDSPGNPGKVEQFKTRAMGGKTNIRKGHNFVVFLFFFSSVNCLMPRSPFALFNWPLWNSSPFRQHVRLHTETNFRTNNCN